MNVKHLERKLIAVARAHTPSDRVPYSFETRVLALLAGRLPLDRWATWAGALWRGAAASLALMAVLTAVCWLSPAAKAPSSSPDLAQAFEKTLLAGVDADDYSQ